MPKKKSSKSRTPIAKPMAALATSNLPKPRRVHKDKVGEAVQDFIEFGGAKAVETHEESGTMWLVTATA